MSLRTRRWLRAPESRWSCVSPRPSHTRRPTPPAPEAEASPAEKPNRVPAFVAFGIGAAGLAVGTVSGLLAFGKKGDVSQACRGDDTSGCASQTNTGNRYADISTGAFIGGGVAVAVGAVLFFAAPGRQDEATAGQLRASKFTRCSGGERSVSKVASDRVGAVPQSTENEPRRTAASGKRRGGAFDSAPDRSSRGAGSTGYRNIGLPSRPRPRATAGRGDSHGRQVPPGSTAR